MTDKNLRGIQVAAAGEAVKRFIDDMIADAMDDIRIGAIGGDTERMNVAEKMIDALEDARPDTEFPDCPPGESELIAAWSAGEPERAEQARQAVAEIKARALDKEADFFAGGLHCADMRLTPEETVRRLRRQAQNLRDGL